MAYKVLSVETEPVSLELAKKQCRLDIDSDEHPEDELIKTYISAARGHCEEFLGFSIAKKTIELVLDTYPCGDEALELIAPATRIVSVKFYDEDNQLQTLDPVSYELDGYSNPSWLILLSGYSWPNLFNRPNALRVVYETGYGDDSDSEVLPPTIKAAVLLTLAHLYENREEVTDKAVYELPLGVQSLLRPLRTRLGMS